MQNLGSQHDTITSVTDVDDLNIKLLKLLKYLGSRLQNDESLNAEVRCREQAVGDQCTVQLYTSAVMRSVGSLLSYKRNECMSWTHENSGSWTA